MNPLRTTSSTFVLALCIASYAFGASSSSSSVSNSSGGVTVNATYSTPQPQNELRFTIVMDAQTVNLDRYYLKNIALLRDASGKTHQPVKVEANGNEHHRSAEIYFQRPAGGAQEIELVIKDVAGVKERVLRFWIS
jgi:hypothetical protein